MSNNVGYVSSFTVKSLFYVTSYSWCLRIVVEIQRIYRIISVISLSSAITGREDLSNFLSFIIPASNIYILTPLDTILGTVSITGSYETGSVKF